MWNVSRGPVSVPVDHISQEVIVLEPVVDVHLLIVDSQCAGLDAALLKKKLREIIFFCVIRTFPFPN